MEQLKSLTKVTDGKISPLAGDAAYNFALFLPWGGLSLGLHVVSGGGLTIFLVLGIAAAGAFALVPDAAERPAPGVWLTGRKALWKRWIDRAGTLTGTGVSALAALIAGLKGASAWGTGYLWIVTAVFAVQAGYLFWRGRAFPKREVELRIDAEGVYSRALGGTLTWDQIERIAPRERGDRQLVRLVVGPNSLKALPSSRREQGGPIVLGLSEILVSREEVVAAMVAVRPSLEAVVEAAGNASDTAMVQPIIGAATDDSPPDEVAVLAPVLVGVAIGGMMN